MRPVPLITIAMGLLTAGLAAGCSQQPDAVFKAEISARIQKVENATVASAGNKFRFSVSDASYDIRKTDSLVSPLEAQVRCRLIQEMPIHLADRTERSIQEGTMEVRYAYREGKWVTTGSTFNYDVSKLVSEQGNVIQELRNGTDSADYIAEELGLWFP